MAIDTTNVYKHNQSILIVYVGFISHCYMFRSVLWTIIRQSQYAQHILEIIRTYNTTEGTMDALHIKRKGQLLDTMERLHIYDLSRQNYN
jgi:hypothetical protein